VASLPTALDSAELLRVLSAWALGDVVRCADVAGGATNRVYRVESARGVTFLRSYRRQSAELVVREHGVIAHARAAGLPAPAPIALRAGGTVLSDTSGVYALYEAARGKQLSDAELSLEHARAAGECLGRLHAALRTLPDAGYGRWQLEWDGPAWVERLNVIERAILGTESKHEGDALALVRVRAQRTWLASSQARHQYTPQFAPQLVHGDFQEANLFFDAQGVSAVIDWEQTSLMPRAYEAARACAFMFRLEPTRTQTFLSAYRALSGASEAEIEDGARAWGTFSDHHVWGLEEIYLNRNPRARRYIRPFEPFDRAWSRAVTRT
jgi:homoserine kinase type II